MKVAVLLLALAVVATQAAPQGKDPVATLTEAKTDLAKAIWKAAGADDELANPNARVTVLAPTDEAVKTFLKDMGLTLDDVKKNPNLARAIVAYHVILGTAAGPKELFAKDKSVSVKTADPRYKLIFTQKPDGSVTVTDVQGNEAKVTKASLGSGKHTVHVIDKVLYSGSYFKDLASVIKAYPSMFSTVAAAATKAGLADGLTKQGFTDTIFLPTNAAFKKAGIDLEKTDKATLEKVLKYHVLSGARRIPDGFTSGKAVATLDKGQDVTVTTKAEDKPDTVVPGLKTRRAYVTDAKGNTAMVIKPNLIIGKAVAHVIDGVLSPKAAAVTTEAGAKPAVAAGNKPTAAPAAGKPAAAKPAATTGRKLLVGGGNAMYRSEFAPSIALDSSEQAIQRAVSAGSSLAATQAATGSLENAEVLSTYPEHATYADGVSGSVAALASGGN